MGKTRGKYKKPPDRTAGICACGHHGFVGLTHGLVALFDASALSIIEQSNWCALITKAGPYARGRIGGKALLMHRAIMDAPDGMVVDHQNHDTLDNRRQNLRVCTQSNNLKNMRASIGTSRFKGVHKTSSGSWGAQICSDGVRVNLGCFESEAAAAAAYDRAAKEMHGEFAKTNKMISEAGHVDNVSA